MKKYFLYPLRGALNLSLLICATIIAFCVTVISWIGISIFLKPFTFLSPVSAVHARVNRYLQQSPSVWTFLCQPIFLLNSTKSIDIDGAAIKHSKQSYLLVSNHLTWIDILVLNHCFYRRSPSPRYFLKKQILWALPLVGIPSWMLNFPMMRRPTKSQIRKNPKLKSVDVETTQKACQQFILNPVTVVNFSEGTRFTEAKRVHKRSPYQHLLPAKSAGIAIVLKEMKHHLAGIIDVTLCYKPANLNFWNFLCGNFDKIHCHYEILPIEDHLIGDYMQDRKFRQSFQAWLNARWALKDKKLQELKEL